MDSNSKSWYERSYAEMGAFAQRRYPNEECSRFIGRNFSHLSKETKSSISCLEVGCGSGSNLWMLVEQGFNVTGLDIAENSLDLCRTLIQERHQTIPNLICASMTEIPLENNSQDFIVDIFSSNCLTISQFDSYLDEASRVLKSEGSIFIYTPSKKSDAYLNSSPAIFLDNSTLDGISRPNSPYFGNNYPFRFEHIEELKAKFQTKDFKVGYEEILSRTYHGCKEYFEFISLEVIKN